MADHIGQTLRELETLAETHERVAVGFSGGKDSLTVLDLAVRHFKTVIPYFYYFVPGIKCEEAKIASAFERYGLTPLRYPAVEGIEALRIGLFCDEHDQFDGLNLTRRTLYNWIKANTRATLILDGEKKSDGIFRRRRMANQAKTMADVVHPIREWLKWEVLSYLKTRNIPVPDAGRGDTGAVCLIDAEVLHLYKHHREDFDTLAGYFPYVWSVIYREQWFGDLPIDTSATRRYLDRPEAPHV
jgi:PP-loop superfamily ATP-utilizing enzyme